MDVPVKKLVRLLKPEQPADVRAAAIVVAGELAVKDAELSAEIVARLGDDSPEVRLAALRGVGKLKLSKALPTLLDRIKSGGEEASLAAEAAARMGPDGVKGLQTLMHTVVPGVRRYIASALTSAGTPEAAVAVLTDKDQQISAAAANAIVNRARDMSPEQKSAFAEALVAVASNKKEKLPGTAELPVVRVLAALNDPSAAYVLWDRTQPPYPVEVRAAALQAVGGWVMNPSKDHWKKLFAAAVAPEFAVAAPALVVLNRLPVTDKQLPEWLALLYAPDVAARRLALDKIGPRDTPELAEALMAQLPHADKALRDAARSKLALMEHGRQALAGAVLKAANPDEAWALARSIAPFAAGFAPKMREELFERACEFLEANDHRADALLFLLKEADAVGLRDQIHDYAVARRKKKDYEAAVKYLKLLARDPSVGLPIRLELALCGLKLSGKELAADFRATDNCLRQFEHIIGQDADTVLKTIEKAKWLDADEVFYLGFHFAERASTEKDFGVAMLKLVGKLSPKTKLATSAKNKLKSVGGE